MQGIYVHVPFCARKCAYCDFYSVVPGGNAVGEFCGLLPREMEIFRAAYPAVAAQPADTVYFGGGTPTVLGAARLCGLLSALRERFPIDGAAEISVEANPGTVTGDDLAALRDGGFNRLSIGVQSFRPSTLSVLGRIHGLEEVHATYREARRARFPAVGIDLIYGIPGQSAGDWEEDLDRAVTFLPDHVSAYALAPEAGTPIREAIARGELSLPPEEVVADMYEKTHEVLARAGYLRYEISNFARPGRACRHNLKYWRREGYLGFGPSAHGLLFPDTAGARGVRTANPPSFGKWAEGIRRGDIPWAERRELGAEDAWKEALIAGLRLTDGVDLAEVEKRNGPPPGDLRRAVDELAAAGKLAREGTVLRLPGHLFIVSNEVLVRLV